MNFNIEKDTHRPVVVSHRGSIRKINYESVNKMDDKIKINDVHETNARASSNIYDVLLKD